MQLALSKVLWGVLLGSCVWAGAAQALTPQKSDVDHREYRSLTLKNGLRILLISDPRAQKAAAALDVHIGHHQNPPEREGLAHFLEHMLFLGTETYPEPDAYQTFISAHGGSHNAYTSAEHTNYYFDIGAAYLEPALDRFARFFTEPLFNAEYVERERHAVDSEFKAKLNDDARRIQDVHRALMNPEHPASRFSVGNLDTLANTEERPLRKDVLAFYQRHYSADLMTLVVLGRAPLDELQKQVTERFKAVPRREVELADTYPPLFEKGRLPLRVEIEPEKEIRRLSLLFPIPVSNEVLTHKPLHYISHLLGHEGEGSLLSLLKDLGWAEGLVAGRRQQDRHSGLFQISIELTELGVRASDQIVALVFHVIESLAQKGVEPWRYEELQQMASIDFRFQEVRSPIATVRGLAHRMHLYEPRQVLKGEHLYAGYDAEMIKRYLGYLNSENVMVSLVAPGIEGNKTSAHYQTPYRVLEQPAEQPDIKLRVQKRLALPQPNDFIPTRLAVKEAPLLPSPGGRPAEGDERPTLVSDQSRLKVWFQWDNSFEVPKTSMRLRLKLPAVAASAQGAARAELLAMLVRDQLNEFAYPAQLAGLEFSLQPNTRGLDIEIFGYSGRQNLLLTKIVEALRRGRFEPDRFIDQKSKLQRRWRNEALAEPYGVIARQIPRLHFSPYWLGVDKLEALEGTDLEALHAFADNLLDDAELEALLYGNLYRQEAVRLAAYLEHQLLGEQTRRTLPPANVYRLNSEGPWARHQPLEHDDNVTLLYVQGLQTDLKDEAHMQLLQRMLRPSFFHQLRTEKQLGYIVTVFPLALKDLQGTALVVQSPSVSSDRLWREIDAFLSTAGNALTGRLANQQAALSGELREPAKTLYQQSSYYWDSLVLGDFDFDRRTQLADAVEAVTPESLQAYYQRVFNDAKRRLWLVSDRLTEGAGEAPAPQGAEAPEGNDGSPAPSEREGQEHTTRADAHEPAWVEDIPAYRKALDALVYP
ncbi:insulinase family protein [Marinimicrobium agarilyticum]|uniref:insulinase family protein n=1 Tax=Marinimicrobium agarilyticum TaxID=306546 RepID=UPI0006881C97|nr:insulinase family protein [Marinimicrobium agarilyticum]